jgi:hypothetical protein
MIAAIMALRRSHGRFFSQSQFPKRLSFRLRTIRFSFLFTGTESGKYQRRIQASFPQITADHP